MLQAILSSLFVGLFHFILLKCKIQRSINDFFNIKKSTLHQLTFLKYRTKTQFSMVLFGFEWFRLVQLKQHREIIIMLLGYLKVDPYIVDSCFHYCDNLLPMLFKLQQLKSFKGKKSHQKLSYSIFRKRSKVDFYFNCNFFI